MYLGVPAGSLHTEGAGEGTSAVGFNHRSKFAVKEFVLDAGEPWRWDLVDLLLSVPHLRKNGLAIGCAIHAGGKFPRADFFHRHSIVEKALDNLGCQEISF